MAAAGAPIGVVANALGHGDASTATVYADLYDEDLQAVAGRLDERLSGSGVARSGSTH